MNFHSSFDVVEHALGFRLIIRDVGPHDQFKTVTNDVENVVRVLAAHGLLSRLERLFYFDSDGDFSEIIVNDGRFVRFAPATEQEAADIVDVVNLNPGNRVLCDSCDVDFTDLTESGGIFGFGRKAICPRCAPRWIANAKKDNELHFIKASCPEGKSFADWVRQDVRTS